MALYPTKSGFCGLVEWWMEEVVFCGVFISGEVDCERVETYRGS